MKLVIFVYLSNNESLERFGSKSIRLPWQARHQQRLPYRDVVQINKKLACFGLLSPPNRSKEFQAEAKR